MNFNKKEYLKQYYLNNKDKLNTQNKKWYQDNKETVLAKDWSRSILKRFGMTPEQYYEMEKKQGYRCAICKTDKPDNRITYFNEQSKWHIDHCHETNKVRGLLCFNCNSSLGGFKDDPKLLEQAISYLVPFDYDKYKGNTQWI
jgi:hypothetical protein